MKGIERLSEELKLERQKANQALQDRARLKIELESLKQSMESQRHEQQDLLKDNLSLKQQVNTLEREREALQQLQHEQDETLSHLNREREGLLRSMQGLDERVATLQQDNVHYQDELKKASILQDTATNKLNAKEELIQHLKEELLSIRSMHSSMEQEKLSTFQQLHEQTAANEELQTKLQLVDVFESGYQQTRSSNDDLRVELENSLTLNTTLNESIHELSSRLSEKSAMERSLNDQIKMLVSERDEYSVIVAELDKTVNELHSQLTTETQTRLALQEKADFAVQNRSFLDDQLVEVRRKFDEVKDENLQLMETENHYRQQMSQLEEENVTLLSQLKEMEHMQEEVRRSQSLSSEIESLRSQLSQMRKKLVQRDLEDEAGVLAPQAIVDREQQGRQVYEGIIQDLRLEIDRLNTKYHELLRRHDDHAARAGRLEQLEEEVDMYKEMVKNLSAESQT
jgi:chromosome segregation ATPase